MTSQLNLDNLSSSDIDEDSFDVSDDSKKSFDVSEDSFDDYYTSINTRSEPQLNLDDITNTQGKLYYFISKEIENKNPLIKEYIFSDEEKNQYCNINKFMYNDILYDFKMYTLEIPFTYYKNITYYTFYLILLEEDVDKRGLIYLQNKETFNKNKSYYDIRCIFNNKCNKKYNFSEKLVNKKTEIFEALLQILKDIFNKDNLDNLFKIMTGIDDLSIFKILDSYYNSAYLRLIHSYNIYSMDRLFKIVSSTTEATLSFYEQLLDNIGIDSISDYFKCNYFGMNESWSSGRVDEAQYCIKLSDKYDEKYETYVDILHSHPRCDFEKYKKFKKLDVMFTLIYKVLSTINFKGEIFIEDASKYYIDIPSNFIDDFDIIQYECEGDECQKITKTYNNSNVFDDKNSIESKKYIAFETHIFSAITKKHTLYSNYGFKPDYNFVFNNRYNIKEFYNTIYNTINFKLNDLLNDTNKDNINNIKFELENMKLPSQITFYDVSYVYNLIIQLLNIWFQIYHYEYYDKYNKLYQKENNTTNNLNYLIIDKDSINFWNHFYSYNITELFIELFFGSLIFKEKANDISEFNKSYPLFFETYLVPDKMDLPVSNIPKYTTSFRKGSFDLSKTLNPYTKHNRKNRIYNLPYSSKRISTRDNPFSLSSDPSIDLSLPLSSVSSEELTTIKPINPQQTRTTNSLVSPDNSSSDLLQESFNLSSYDDDSKSLSSSLSESLSESLSGGYSNNINLNIKYKQFNKKYYKKQI